MENLWAPAKANNHPVKGFFFLFLYTNLVRKFNIVKTGYNFLKKANRSFNKAQKKTADNKVLFGRKLMLGKLR